LDNALDEYLVLLAQDGSHEAFARLAARWTPKLAAFASRALGSRDTAMDVVQETWLSAMRGLNRLEDPARFPAWIHAIAARKCTDAVRSKYRARRVVAASEALAGSSGAPRDEESALGDRIDIAAGIAALPPEQRIAVALFFGADLSVVEIAATVGAPAGTVKSRLFAARRTLRARLEGEES